MVRTDLSALTAPSWRVDVNLYATIHEVLNFSLARGLPDINSKLEIGVTS